MKGYLMVSNHYTHLTYEERCQISRYLERKISVSGIALGLRRSYSTIHREIERGQSIKQTDKKQYCPRFAQRAYEAKRRTFASCRVYNDFVKSYVVEKLKEKWSPEQIAGRLKRDHPEYSISHETIYQHIWRDKKAGGVLYKNLRRNGRKYKKRSGKYNDRGILGRIDIDFRPDIVEEKIRIGDWEGDLVMGNRQDGSALVTMVDRASKYTKIGFVSSKKADEVRNEIITMMLPLKEKVLTMTYDNGREFAHHQSISGSLDADTYFAKPYHSWERGLNEHTNGLIRQYCPKGSSFQDTSNEKIQNIQEALNNRPRKVLGYKTPNEVFFSDLNLHTSSYALPT